MTTITVTAQDAPSVNVRTAALTDPALSLKAKGLYAMITAIQELPGRRAPISQEALYRTSTDGRDSVTSGLRELEAAGYLTRIVKAKSGRSAALEFIVHPNRDDTRTGGGDA